MTLSSQANNKVSELYERVRLVTAGEKALREEAKLIERMYQLTSEYFIGRATEKVILRDVALDFGFDVGSSEHLRGARVASVDPAGPAHKAGLQKGDIIAAVSGRNAMGLDHTQVRRMIQRVIEDDAGMLVLSVAAPLGSGSDHTDGEEGVEMGSLHGDASRDAQDRPKPPSYVVIRNKLRNEFGDATYERCKRRVQNHVESLSRKYDIMGGNKPSTQTERVLCTVNTAAIEVGKTTRSWAQWMKDKYFPQGPGNSYESPNAASSYSFTEVDPITNSLLENMDDDELETHRAREESNNIRLQETLQDVLDSEDPPAECREIGGTNDEMLPALSVDGVTKYLVRKHGKETVKRNMQLIMGKLSEREMMMVSL